MTMNLNYSVGSYCWSMDCIFYMRGACAFFDIIFVLCCVVPGQIPNHQPTDMAKCVCFFSFSQSSLFHLHVNGWQLHFSLTTLSATDQRIRILNAKFQRRYNDDGKTHRMTFIDNINKLLHMTAVFKFTQPIFEIGISMDAAKMPTICLPNC